MFGQLYASTFNALTQIGELFVNTFQQLPFYIQGKPKKPTATQDLY